MVYNAIHLPKRVPTFSQTQIGPEGKLINLELLKQKVRGFVTHELTRICQFKLNNIEKAEIIQQHQLACKLALKIIQQAKNHAGTVQFTNLSNLNAVHNPSAKALLNLLIGAESDLTSYTALNVLCKHRFTLIKNWKPSFCSINYTNHAKQFLDFVDAGFGLMPSSDSSKFLIRMSNDTFKVDARLINDEKEFNQLLTYLTSKNCLIKNLDVSQIDLHKLGLAKGQDAFLSLIGALKNNWSVTSLNLSECGLTDNDLSHISELARLTNLQVNGNKIGAVGARYLTKLVNLTSLFINNNRLGARGALYISKLTHLTVLFISKNQLGAEGAFHVAKLVNLINLGIDNNQIGDVGAQHISKHLLHLTILSIEHNQLTAAGAKHISTLINLIILNINSNYLGDRGVKYITRLVQLKILGINNNLISSIGAKYIATRLIYLTTLYIQNNWLGDEGALHLSKLNRLTFLAISNNTIRDSGVYYIASRLKNLTSLYIKEGNQIGVAGNFTLWQLLPKLTICN